LCRTTKARFSTRRETAPMTLGEASPAMSGF